MGTPVSGTIPLAAMWNAAEGSQPCSSDSLGLSLSPHLQTTHTLKVSPPHLFFTSPSRSTQIATWFVLPFYQVYAEAGDFSVKNK